MPGIYLQCDQCSATVDGAEATRGTTQSPLNFSQKAELMAFARSKGWTKSADGARDLCPACAPPHPSIWPDLSDVYSEDFKP